MSVSLKVNIMIPKDYQQANNILGMKTKHVIKNKRATYLQRNEDSIALVYHNTPVVTYHKDNSIKLNSGGYRSLTTKARMNSALGNRAYVFQKNHKWYLAANGMNYSFVDGVIV